MEKILDVGLNIQLTLAETYVVFPMRSPNKAQPLGRFLPVFQPTRAETFLEFKLPLDNQLPWRRFTPNLWQIFHPKSFR